jgi:hypothetical protein
MEGLVAAFNDLAREAQTLTFLTRGIELQELMEGRVLAFIERLGGEKRERISTLDEEGANTILSMELCFQMVLQELRMWMSLKRDQPELAWNHLVSAQHHCLAAITVRRQLVSKPATGELENIYQKLLVIERVVYPPQIFNSIGGIAKRRECSICGGDYDSCPHIRGRAYMGKLCHTIVQELRLDEVSIVDEPADKRCRITHFSDSGKRRNKMTWRLEEEESSPGTAHSILAVADDGCSLPGKDQI